MNITELKELAEKATPGPWKHRNGRIFQLDYEALTIANVARAFDGDYSPANGELLAAANPAAMLELIAKLEDAQGEIRALRATEAGLRDRLAAVEADRAQRVPDGWKLVPVDPTDRMLNAASLATESEGMVTTPWLRKTIYFAMLSAAPAQPAQQEKSKVISKFTDAVFDLAKDLAGIPPTQPAKQEKEPYSKGWVKVTLMVSPDGGTVHAVEGDRAEGDGDQLYLGLDRMKKAGLLAPPQPVERKPMTDPCPGCAKGHVCRTPKCGRLALPVDHPLRCPTPGIRE